MRASRGLQTYVLESSYRMGGTIYVTYLYPCIVSQLLAALSDYLSACLAGL